MSADPGYEARAWVRLGNGERVFDAPPETDDEYEWTEVSTADGRVVHRFGRCLHARLEPVTLTDGEVVAQLCLGCDEQLPAGWKP